MLQADVTVPIYQLEPRCLELCIKVMRKRLQRDGGTQNGKSELDSSSYAEFYQEHDGNLTLDVWWPNHE